MKWIQQQSGVAVAMKFVNDDIKQGTSILQLRGLPRIMGIAISEDDRRPLRLFGHGEQVDFHNENCFFF